jgi:hypothetical protein
MHKRTEIRNKIAEMLRSNLTGFNIYNSRVLNIPENKLPAISIYTPDDTAEKSEDEGNYRRLFEVHIVYYVSGQSRREEIETGDYAIDELIDNYLEDLETLFFNKWETLENVVYRFNYESTSIRPMEKTKDLIFIADTVWSALVHHNMV